MSCYNCKYRGSVPGSAHSRCNLIKEIDSTNSVILEELFLTGKLSFTFKNDAGIEENAIKLNPHGVKNGWAYWPLDFDPIWVESCKFEELQIQENP